MTQLASLETVPAWLRYAADEVERLIGSGVLPAPELPAGEAARWGLVLEVSDRLRSATSGALLGALSLVDADVLTQIRRLLISAETSPDRTEGDGPGDVAR